jgi:hypothetical protein
MNCMTPSYRMQPITATFFMFFWVICGVCVPCKDANAQVKILINFTNVTQNNGIDTLYWNVQSSDILFEWSGSTWIDVNIDYTDVLGNTVASEILYTTGTYFEGEGPNTVTTNCSFGINLGNIIVYDDAGAVLLGATAATAYVSIEATASDPLPSTTSVAKLDVYTDIVSPL